jgi:hypothetical protein
VRVPSPAAAMDVDGDHAVGKSALTPSHAQYFDVRYVHDRKEGAEHLYVHEYPNGVCVLGLAHNHAIRVGRKRIVKVAFAGSEGIAAAVHAAPTNGGNKQKLFKQTSAKRKRKRENKFTKGAQLCVIECADASTHVVRYPCSGQKLQENPLLVDTPSSSSPSSSSPPVVGESVAPRVLSVCSDPAAAEFEGFLVIFQPRKERGTYADYTTIDGEEYDRRCAQ